MNDDTETSLQCSNELTAVLFYYQGIKKSKPALLASGVVLYIILANEIFICAKMKK
jgi:hypothetical protein